MHEVRIIGYWRSDRRPDLPDPADFIDSEIDDDRRGRLASYLNSGTLAAAFLGLSTCRLCGAENGSVEYTDGMYVWPEGLAHYVREHSVRLPTDVEAHIEARLDALEELRTRADLRWWLETTQH